MRWIDEGNAVAYLREQGWLPEGVRGDATTLSGGVSNVVLRIQRDDGRADVILKQVREQLRTPDPWFSQPDRILKEMDVLRILQEILPAGSVPTILWEDRANYLFVMEAIEPGHRVWKNCLLAGEVDLGIGERLGMLLAKVHAGTIGNEQLREQFGDLRMFDELRVDPYYRRLWRDFPEERNSLQKLIDDSLTHRISLVLADFSPKNILIHSGGVTLVDFETGHFGDPAFDLGFFLSHLSLKTILHAGRADEYFQLIERFLAAYRQELGDVQRFATEGVPLEQRGIQHLAGCMWARVDGTSRVDYLNSDSQKDLVRRFCRGLFHSPAPSWTETFTRLAEEIRKTYS
ncbi:MAG: aminoglycoside phosphotransferase family protein [Planctomycetales bacterium]